MGSRGGLWCGHVGIVEANVVTGPAAVGHTDGAFHEAAVYSDDDEFLAIVVPFLIDGLESGAPTFSVFDSGRQQLLRDVVRDDSVRFLDKSDLYARPASTIASYRSMLRELVDGGVSDVRVVGDLPHAQVIDGWDKWARYEAALNEVFNDFPLWVLCSYDTRITADSVIAEVQATHPYIAGVDGRHYVNEAFIDPYVFLRERAGRPIPAEPGTPDLDMFDPLPSDARRVLRRSIESSLHLPDGVDDLVLAVSEIVTNAIVHGRRPVRLQAWISDTGCVVRVTDQGHGPTDPLAGLTQKTTAIGSGGQGLWIAQQICAEVDLLRDSDGFTVRIESPLSAVPA